MLCSTSIQTYAKLVYAFKRQPKSGQTYVFSLNLKIDQVWKTAGTHPLDTCFSPNFVHKLSKILSGTYIPMLNLEINRKFDHNVPHISPRNLAKS